MFFISLRICLFISSNICLFISSGICLFLSSRVCAIISSRICLFVYFFRYMFIYLHCFTSTGKALRQNITTAYSDYTYKLSGINRPSPRLISQLLFAKDVNFTYTPNQRNLTAMSAFFGKLLSRIERCVNTSLI